MKESRFPIKTGNIPPCRAIEKIDHEKAESDSGAEYKILKIRGKNWNQWCCIVYRFLNDRFTMTINKKEMDFESLVGYIGGYVGLFAGFAFAEIPGMLSNGIVSMKKYTF